VLYCDGFDSACYRLTQFEQSFINALQGDQMREQRMPLLTAREAAEYLHVSPATLGRMEKKGQLVPFRTPGGHRRYSLVMLDEYLAKSRRRSPATTSPVE